MPGRRFMAGMRFTRDRAGAGAQADRPRLVAQPFDGRLLRPLDPRALARPAARAIAEDARHEKDSLQADPACLIRLAQMPEAVERPRRARPVLSGGARQAEALFRVVSNACEAEARPRAARGHFGENLAEAGLELVLERDQAADLAVEIF